MLLPFSPLAIMPLIHLGSPEQISPITINCEEIKCDKLEINYEEQDNSKYCFNTENELEIRIEGLVNQKVKAIVDQIMGNVNKDLADATNTEPELDADGNPIPMSDELEYTADDENPDQDYCKYIGESSLIDG